MSREQAAAGRRRPGHTAKFHLDRLVDEGLLEVEFRRLTGRTGPGAGRPAKLYRRSDRELAVSLPARAATTCSAASWPRPSAAATASGEPVADVAATRGRATRARGSAGGIRRARGRELRRLAGAPRGRSGYEPRVDDGTLVLRNCPFHRVAQEHTELVCGLNLEYVDGVREGLGCAGVETSLDPVPGGCCVIARASDTGRVSRLDPAVAARLKRKADGLVPAVVQQHDTGEVLMLGWMDDEALARTLTTGRATYWSRSRQEYWVKGETSGHRQWVREVRLDCDGDTLLVKVDQEGPACHTGDRTCFDADVLLAADG